MKTIFITWMFLVFSLTIYAQSPNQFKFQAVLRDTNGIIIANQSKTVVIDILQGDPKGISVFSESHNVTTSAYGIINLNIGSINTSSISLINWSKDRYFLRIMVDGVEMGTSELLSVPYALYASKAGDSFSGNFSDLSSKPNSIAGYGIQDAATRAYVDSIVEIKMNELEAKIGTKIKDVDGNYYKIVNIGTQTWMAENLKTTKYNDGTAIPYVKNNSVWVSCSSDAYCWYNNDSIVNKKIYGALYNRYVVINQDLKNVCPNGWHIPSYNDWVILYNYLGADSGGGKLKEKGTVHWKYPNKGAMDTYGFTALPGGERHYIGEYWYLGEYGFWWSSTFEGNTIWWISWINYDQSALSINFFKIKNLMPGYSIRCLKDK